ncbi:unnamed protein product [Tetraodon nigroviridis]|uniref:(spotted green pufferfish) hypothetical protein n=1 Tax=Tetraodon nigroviridis TaxID=99883 RepID=Q4SB48_TETNG|nr:unnamed protein product [Tetraodon nigroviridis]
MASRQKRLLFSLAALLGSFCALAAAVATGLPSLAPRDRAVPHRSRAGQRHRAGAGQVPGRAELRPLPRRQGEAVRPRGEAPPLLVCLVLVLFPAEVKLHHLSDRISNFNELSFTFQTFSEQYDRCFWLFLLVFLIHGLNVVLIRLAGVRFPFQKPKEVDLSGGAADLMY